MAKTIALRMVTILLSFGHSECNRVKINGYTFRGSDSAISIFASLLNIGQLLKERICFCRSKFFPLRVDPITHWFNSPGKQEGSYLSSFPVIKQQKKNVKVCLNT